MAEESISANARSLDVTCEGQLFKCSHKTGEWEERWGYITYGIFTYFSNEEKCTAFKNYLHDITSSESLRERFRGALRKYQPRGYIKVLNKIGECVSKVHLDLEDNSFKIFKDARFFHLRTPNREELQMWQNAFMEMSVDVHDSVTPSPSRLNPSSRQCRSFSESNTVSTSTTTDENDHILNESIELDRLDKQLAEQINDLKKLIHEEEEGGSFLKNIVNLTQQANFLNSTDFMLRDSNEENVSPMDEVPN